MARQEFVYPVGMFLQLCDSADIFSLYKAFGSTGACTKAA